MHEHLQFLYEFAMAIGTSLDLRKMLRKSISTTLRQLNCQGGAVLFYNQLHEDTFEFEMVFSIPREIMRIEEYKQIADELPDIFNTKWRNEFTQTLPSHVQTVSGKHMYFFDLPDIGICILLKNEKIQEHFLVKSFAPLFNKLATACHACLQNQELIEHRNNLEHLVENKTNELIEQNIQLELQVKERQVAEKELREAQQRYEAVVQQASEGIILLDPETKLLLDYNSSFQSMLGYEHDELMRLGVYDLVMQDQNIIDSGISRVLNEDKVYIGDRKYITKSGNLIDVEVSGSLISYGGKQAIAYVIRDTSIRKKEAREKEKLKEQLRQAQKFEALGSLAGGVAHDLNNILSGIVSYPELLLSKIDDESHLKRPLEVIHDSGRRATAIVEELLTIARSAASKKEVHNLNTIISEYLESPEHLKLQSEHPKISYVQTLNPDAPHIFCSSVHIKKCVMNLVINATEAIADNGTVTITTSLKYIDPINGDYPSLPHGQCAALIIHDNGPGIPKEDLNHIFEPFYTRKTMGKSGTGLGLTVVWNTIADHSGHISVYSDETGTSFESLFPTREKTQANQEVKKVNQEQSRKKATILIVDDEEVLREIASEMLEHLGYRVQTVVSGEKAIEFVKNNPVDLLIIDMIMDPGMSGRKTFEEIIKIQPEVKAVIASGYSDSKDVEETLRLGAKCFMQKPYSLEQMESAVLKALHVEQ